MRFQYSDDQATFAGFLGQMLDRDSSGFRILPDWERFEYGASLDALLEQNGFFDAAAEDGLGPVMAADMVMAVNQRPVVVECGASALLRPLIAPDLPRPVAVLVGEGAGPVRFAPLARSLIWITAGSVRSAQPEEGAIAPTESLFAYPMGIVDPGTLDWADLAADPAQATSLWRVAVAAEMVGTAKGGLDAVTAYVTDRQQFGRPLGSFQGIQHRLATAAVQIEAARWMCLRAAQSGDAGDCAMALGYVQNNATRIGYDLHQFMGAMGLTLEHPLHRWTYRLRLLRSEMGGAPGSLLDLARHRWGEP